jgi:hypothetical protein
VETAGARATLSLPLVPGEAEDVRVDAPPTIVADGRRDAVVHVAVVDRFGNAVAAPAPVVAAELGEVGAPAAGTAGGWTYRYRPRRHESDARETVRATAGPIAGSASIDLARAPRRLTVAPRVGLVAAAGRVTPLAELAATAWRGEGGALELGVSASWFALARSEPIAVAATALPFRARADFLSVLATAGWRRPLGGGAHGWISGGAGATRVVGSAAAGSGPTVKTAGVAAMGQLGLGIGLRALGGLPFAEVRVAYHLDPDVETFVGPLLATSLCLGYRFDVR